MSAVFENLLPPVAEVRVASPWADRKIRSVGLAWSRLPLLRWLLYFYLQRSERIIVDTALSVQLARPLPAKDTLNVLRNIVGFSDKELARVLNVTDRSVKRWRAGASISTESEELLFDLARVIAALAELELPPSNIRAWFFYRNPFIGNERPIDVYAKGGYKAVQPAISAIQNSVFA